MLVIIKYLQYLYQIVIIYSVLSVILTQNFNNNNNFHNVIINNTNVSINDWLTTRPLTTRPLTDSSQTLFTSHTPNLSLTSWTLSPYLSCHNDSECSPHSHCTQDLICICDQSFIGIVFTFSYI